MLSIDNSFVMKYSSVELVAITIVINVIVLLPLFVYDLALSFLFRFV